MTLSLLLTNSVKIKISFKILISFLDYIFFIKILTLKIIFKSFHLICKLSFLSCLLQYFFWLHSQFLNFTFLCKYRCSYWEDQTNEFKFISEYSLMYLIIHKYLLLTYYYRWQLKKKYANFPHHFYLRKNWSVDC